MIYSMTGYGKGIEENHNLTAEVEVKSVNSRYLDISLRLPTTLMSRELELREYLKNKIRRGKLIVICQLKRKNDEDDLLEVDEEKITGYLSLLKKLKKAAGISEDLKLEHLLYNKDFFTVTNPEYTDEDFKLLKKALDKALDDLVKMRKKEGKELENDLKKRVKMIDDLLVEIEEDAKKSVDSYYEKLKDRMKMLIDDIANYNDRLELELALIADKADITEECVRLRSHIKFFLESLKDSEDPGRKLNFLCQEMNRETNTISSKTISTLITHHTVSIKEEIEKIREQVQNIE